MACSIPLLPSPTLTTVHPAGQQDSRTAGQPGDEGSASLGKEHHGFANRPLLMNSLAPGAGGGRSQSAQLLPASESYVLVSPWSPFYALIFTAPTLTRCPSANPGRSAPQDQEGLPHKSRRRR